MARMVVNAVGSITPARSLSSFFVRPLDSQRTRKNAQCLNGTPCQANCVSLLTSLDCD